MFYPEKHTVYFTLNKVHRGGGGVGYRVPGSVLDPGDGRCCRDRADLLERETDRGIKLREILRMSREGLRRKIMRGSRVGGIYRAWRRS